MTFWDHAKIAIREADIVAEVLDARMPELSRNHEVEELVELGGKFLLFVVNKSDLISGENFKNIKKGLGENAVFVSGSKNLGMRKLKERLIIIGKRLGLERPRVCFVGYPNVGKSSVINALVKRSRTKVSSIAGTTKGIQWVSAPHFKILDSPGVIPFDERDEALIALLGAKNPDKLKLPERAAIEVIKFLKKNYPVLLSRFYNVSGEQDENDIFLEIGKNKRFLIKGGVIDMRRTALTIIRDWQNGKLNMFKQ